MKASLERFQILTNSAKKQRIVRGGSSHFELLDCFTILLLLYPFGRARLSVQPVPTQSVSPCLVHPKQIIWIQANNSPALIKMKRRNAPGSEQISRGGGGGLYIGCQKRCAPFHLHHPIVAVSAHLPLGCPYNRWPGGRRLKAEVETERIICSAIALGLACLLGKDEMRIWYPTCRIALKSLRIAYSEMQTLFVHERARYRTAMLGIKNCFC